MGSYTLDDVNAHPSEAALRFISRHPQTPALISDLLNKNSVVITALHKEMRVTLLLSLKETDRSYLVSFLYYLGALTHCSPQPNDPRAQVCIPNMQARREYVEELRHMFEILEDRLVDLRAAVDQMFSGDIGPLCVFIQTHFLDLQKHNDVIHSMENTLKSVFILAVSIARGTDNTFSEHDLLRTQADAVFLSWKEDGPIIHIEFKNTTVGHIKGQYNTKNWQQMNDYSETLSQMQQDEILKLPLALSCKIYDKHIKREPDTVRDMWTIVQVQAEENSKLLREEHPDKKVITYVVYRIGLQRLLYQRTN